MIATAEYTTSNRNTYRAVPREGLVNPSNVMPAMADFAVIDFRESTVGYIVDQREDDSAAGMMRDLADVLTGDEDEAKRYEAYNSAGQYLTETASLPGAICAVGLNYERGGRV